MSDWQKLGDLVTLQRGTTYLSRRLGEPGPVLLGLGAIQRHGGFKEVKLKTYGGESADKLLLRPGDLFLSLKDVTQDAALLGAVARVPNSVTVGRLTQDTVKLTITRPELKSSYLYWVLRTPQYREYCRQHAIGTTNLSLSREDFLSYSIPPATNNRVKLVSFLEAIESKIAVNDRIAATALELAEALYLQASSGHGWSTIELGSAASWHSGGTPKTSEPRFWGGETPWISASSLKGCWIETSERRLTELGTNSGTRLVPDGVIIFVVRGSSLKEEFRIGLTQREVAFGQDCKALIPFSGLDPHILFHGIRSARNQVLDLVDETSIGAGRLSTDLITKLEIRMPPESANGVVEDIRSLDQLSAVRTRESRGLAALRDTLLPELMSGRLRVKDAEKVVEEAV